MMDLAANMEGCTIFGKIDLIKAFPLGLPEDSCHPTLWIV
jgi:hypothetical protein